MKSINDLLFLFISVFLMSLFSSFSLPINAKSLGILSEESEIGDSINQDWYSAALENIKKSEYNISFAEHLNAYQTPNRKNNLRFIYKNNGFTVKPRETEISVEDETNRMNENEKIKIADDWNAEFTVLGYGRGNKVENSFSGNKFIIEKNTAFVKDKNMKIDYINNEEGMRQNFTVYNKPHSGKGHLTLLLNIETEKRIVVGADALVIKDENKDLMKYSSLKIWDSEGKELRGWFEAINNNPLNKEKLINIVINDEIAVYPVTIDPLSNTEDWQANGGQAYAHFGNSVATAGDVNGDGYSDVIVGAADYDNSIADAGAAFVFLGSAAGLSSTADWSETNIIQANANFGTSVSTAGDVNGDGYSDIVIGAPNVSSGSLNGAIFVYHGSNSGLSSTYDWAALSDQANTNFGSSVSTAGDVNGDGFSDIIVGASTYDLGQTNEGIAVIYYGTSSGLTFTSPALTILESNQASASFGNSVSTAGDVNGDGYSDVIVGAKDYTNGQTNQGGTFLFHGSSGGIQTSASIILKGSASNEGFGISVSTAGDVNGDGYSDVIIGANKVNYVFTDEGFAYVFHGSATGVLGTPNFQARGNQLSSLFGTSVSTAGDVNGDGFADVIIGASTYDNGQTDEGKAFVYFGSSNGLANGTTSIVTAESADWTKEHNQASAYFGESVACAGDVNGDGISDVIIGAQYYESGGLTSEGAAFVYHGSASGLSTTDNWTAESNQALAGFGSSVSTAGDVNGDGYSDVIVGADGYDNGQTNEGRAFVYHGSSSELSTIANWTVESNQASARFGISVSTAGDVNGDGYSDVIIGAHGYDNGQTNEGGAFVYHGSSSGLSTIANWTAEGDKQYAYFGNSVSSSGDVNGDGYSDVIVGASQYEDDQTNEGWAFVYHGSSSGLSTIANWTAESNQTDAYFGESIACAGDVNGDGYSDVIIGAYGYNNGQTDEGAAFVYHGSSSGLSTIANWTAESNQASARFGNSVSTVGDVNGDGYSDVIIGADFYDNGQTNEGGAFVYHGSSSGLSTIANWTAESDKIYAYFGHSVSTAGDVNGDGYSDVIIGAQFYSNGQNNEGRAFVYHGSSSGLSTIANWTAESDQADANYGSTVSTAGDVNGDGYSDVIIGAQFYSNGQTDEGGAFVYYGNAGGGLRSNVQQYKTDETSVIAAGGYSNSPIVVFGIFSKSPFGRADGRNSIELKGASQQFTTGSNGELSNSVGANAFSVFEDLGSMGKEVKSNAFLPEDLFKWRIRTEYSLVNNPYQKYGPWRYYSSYDAKIRDGFRAAIIMPTTIYARLKVFLEGPYNSTNDDMDANLSLPIESPFTEDPISYFGEGFPSNVVDWVLIQLRDKVTPTTIIASKSAFILEDGSIIGVDENPVTFQNPFGEYNVSVKHRNHLQVMTAVPIYLSN